ncbi:MAG: S41 family peptidase [Gemmatimonas sp.]
MTRFRRAALASAFVVPLVVGASAISSQTARDKGQLLEQVFRLVAGRFTDTVSVDQLYEKSARGLVNQLGDPYSELLTPKDLEAFSRTTVGRYGGVGMSLSPPTDGFVMVEQVFPNSPAESRGVQEGDRILAVDTFQVKGWSLDRVTDKLLGDPGTKVSVTYRRVGVPAPITLQFTRARIAVPAVAYHLMLDDQIGYIPLARFSDQTTKGIADAVRDLQSKGARGLILDLRGNPGGIVEEAFGMANLFLPKGKELLSVRERDGTQSMVSENAPIAPDIPMVMLVDGGSASSAEIVAGALQDYDRALLLGTTTYGKGLVQSVYTLDGGYALKITTGKWYTPSGRSIQKPRHFNEDGQWVEVAADSMESSAVRAKRPTYKSAGGRTLYGGGAITPDIIVPADTITTPEQKLRRLLAPHSQKYFQALNVIAEGQKGKLSPSFKYDPAWRTALYNHLVADSVVIDKAVFEAGAAEVDRAIESRVAKMSFGDAIARQHEVKDDSQLRRAISLLRAAKTQSQVFAAADRT